MNEKMNNEKMRTFLKNQFIRNLNNISDSIENLNLIYNEIYETEDIKIFDNFNSIIEDNYFLSESFEGSIDYIKNMIEEMKEKL